MCGIYGIYNNNNSSFSFFQDSIKKMSKYAYQRGKEAAGLAVSVEGGFKMIKSDLNGKMLFKTKEYQQLHDIIKDTSIKALIGHSRIATHGSQLDNKNNQPVLSDDLNFVMVHNGIITNTDKLLLQMGKSLTDKAELDSQILLNYFSYLYNVYGNYEETFKVLFDEIEGSLSIAIIPSSHNSLILASNTGSLFYYRDLQGHTYFSSEKIFLSKTFSLNSTENIVQICPNTYISIENKTTLAKISTVNVPFKVEDFSPSENLSSAIHLYNFNNDINNIKKHDFNYKAIYNLKRCTRCILPSTTPFITFDTKGVCNFCLEHDPITTKGIQSLEEILSKYRTKDKKPNCLAAFSGGRDSSYGLHYLKNDLGMNPLAYTYDWGMVTDVARKNQARILGKLGVEHIVVSADITKKRKHIRENILAWMKKPSLGMVPIFMQGDKQCEYHADKIMKDYNLDLMFFFRGNELEKEEFKNGHCGIKDADPGGVIHHLPIKGKLKLLKFYGKEYLLNPSYINSSFFDTGLAYFSTYIQKHNYVYLWHYVPWNEDKIITTLKKEYNWELSTETNQTWRTDDGTSAFYNYIYYQGQGFTENDSFRSRQIREGILDRKTALELVNEENKPRYEALRWYFDMVGLDGDKVLSVVDKMKKLY